MKDKGITLIELLIAMAILGVLLVATGYSYQDWRGKYDVERATKELHTDMMHARALAMQKNVKHFVVLGDRSYSIIEDTNDNGEVNGGDTTLPGFPKAVGYELVYNNSANNKVTFNARGHISGERTLLLKSGKKPDYDCIRVSDTRIIMGWYNGSQDADVEREKCKIK